MNLTGLTAYHAGSPKNDVLSQQELKYSEDLRLSSNVVKQIVACRSTFFADGRRDVRTSI